MVSKILWPIPLALVKPLPMTATNDKPCSTVTSQSCSNSATTVLVNNDWVEPLGLSNVKATLIMYKCYNEKCSCSNYQ